MREIRKVRALVGLVDTYTLCLTPEDGQTRVSDTGSVEGGP